MALKALNLLLQSDIDNLNGWAVNWQMSFNINKYKVMHIDLKNNQFRYYKSKGGIKTVRL